MMQQWWERYQDAAPAQSQFGARPVFQEGPPQPAPRNPDQAAKDAADVANIPLTRSNLQTNIAQGQKSIENIDFGNEQTLRNSFNALPEVKNYSEALQALDGMFRAPKGPQGDLAIIYGFAKAMDPGSVVREGEMGMAQGTASVVAQLQQKYKSFLEGAGLPDEVRTGLIESARQKTAGLKPLYEQQYQRFSGLAQTKGFKPENVVGQPLPAAVRPDEEAYIRSRGGTPKINGVPIEQNGRFGDGYGAPGTEVMFRDQRAPGSEGAQELHDRIDAAMRSRQVKSYGDLARIVQQFNRERGTAFPPPPKSKETIDAIRASLTGGKFGVTLPEDARVRRKTEEMKKNAGRGTAFKGGVKDAVSLGAADEIRSAVEGFGGALRGEGSFPELYRINRDAERAYQDFLQQTHPGFYTGGQLAGGLAVPIGAGARTPLEMARAGAAAGGIYGSNSGEGGLSDRFARGVEGAAGGGIAGAAFGAGSGLFRGFMQGRGASAAERELERQQQIGAAQSANVLGIDLPRYVAGGATAQRLGALANQSQVAAPIMRRSANLLLNQSEAARDRIAQGTGGRVLDAEGLGERAAIGGAKGRLQAKAGYQRLYNQAEGLSGRVQVQLPLARQNVLSQMVELSSTPGGMDPKFAGVLQDMADKMGGEYTPAAIRRMRTELRNRFVQAGSDPNDASRRAQMIADAAEQDMINGLRTAGKGDAATAWQKASQARAQYQVQKEQIFDPILGARREKSASEVASALRGAVKNNPARVRQFVASMPPEEANDVRASLIGAMGNPGSGHQDVEGKAFSLATFLTHWNDLKGVREQVFDKQTVQALNKLAKVAERAKQQGFVENRSNTGSITIGMMTAGPAASAPGLLLTGNAGAAAGAVVTSVALGLAQAGGAKLLASPKFAQRLAAMPLNPSAASKYWTSDRIIGGLIRSEPAMEAEIRAFQQAVNDNLVRGIAASPDPNEERKKQYPY